MKNPQPDILKSEPVLNFSYSVLKAAKKHPSIIPPGTDLEKFEKMTERYAEFVEARHFFENSFSEILAIDINSIKIK